MAIVLKGYGDATNCGCGCSGGCGAVTSNCNFVLRQYLNDNSQEVTFTTDDEYIIECWNSRNDQPCQGISFGGGTFDICTGEGKVEYSYVNMDGGGSGQSFELGTFTSSYQDESIDFDNIEVQDLTELEQQQKSCKFSYKFNFDPTSDASYYSLGVPCDDKIGYYSVSLTPEGKATFYASYSEVSKKCVITPA